VDKRKKLFLAIGFVGVAVGGFVLAKFLTRNVRKIRGGTVTLQTFDEPPVDTPLTE
jgi:pyrimidine operon attenuation protein/uracil phosphoribosyltransferase